MLTSEQPSERDTREPTGRVPAGARAVALRHIEGAVDILDALLRAPGGTLHEDPLETALDHLYLAASTLRHAPAAEPKSGRPKSGGAESA